MHNSAEIGTWADRPGLHSGPAAQQCDTWLKDTCESTLRGTANRFCAVVMSFPRRTHKVVQEPDASESIKGCKYNCLQHNTTFTSVNHALGAVGGEFSQAQQPVMNFCAYETGTDTVRYSGGPPAYDASQCPSCAVGRVPCPVVDQGGSLPITQHGTKARVAVHWARQHNAVINCPSGPLPATACQRSLRPWASRGPAGEPLFARLLPLSAVTPC